MYGTGSLNDWEEKIDAHTTHGSSMVSGTTAPTGTQRTGYVPYGSIVRGAK